MQSEFVFECNMFGFMQKRLRKELNLKVGSAYPNRELVENDILNPSKSYR